MYFAGDGNDVIVDKAAPGDVDQLVLAGGIGPDEVSLYRPAQSPDDLLLKLASGGSILIKGFLASPSAGIERVAFDHAPAWEREELERLARRAPLLDNRPIAALGPSAGPKPEWSDAVTGLHPRAAVMPTGDTAPDIALNAVF